MARSTDLISTLSAEHSGAKLMIDGHLQPQGISGALGGFGRGRDHADGDAEAADDVAEFAGRVNRDAIDDRADLVRI